eukprot:436228-Rhodomonas_salina.1
MVLGRMPLVILELAPLSSPSAKLVSSLVSVSSLSQPLLRSSCSEIALVIRCSAVCCSSLISLWGWRPKRSHFAIACQLSSSSHLDSPYLRKMDGLSRLQGWALFDGMPSPGMEEQGSMLTQLGSPSRNSNPDRQSPVHLDGSGQGQEVLRSFDSPSPMASRPSIGSGGPGSARSQQKQRMQMGSPMHPNAGVLEPGGGLTNPGPGQFGRGPSPLEGRLGDVVSPPPRMEELSEMLAATQLNGGPPPMLMGGGGMRGRTSVQTQLFSQPDYVSGPMGGGQQGAGQLGANNWQRQMADMPPKGYKTVRSPPPRWHVQNR